MTKFNKLLFLLLTISIVSCGQTQEKKNEQNKSTETETQQIYPMAERIKIDGLRNALTKLKNGQTDYEFIGITSNGIDCIYFVYENGKFNLEFEAMGADQLPYIDRLQDFAISNNFKWIMTTYNNMPQYKSDKPAPVLRLEINSSLEEITKLGERIQSVIFNNNNETVYDVVP